VRVLIACEFSGIVRDAFIKKGHDAWSCDLLNSEKEGPHFKSDIFLVIENYSWDLMIAFPPCTHLAVSGARWFKNKIKEQNESLDFVRRLMYCNIPKIAIENPVGIISTKIRKPDQVIQPWEFGHNEEKRTCLWLKRLPKLKATKIIGGGEPRIHWESPGKDRWKRRSRFYSGIAKAMANQWG
jgi:hypothetical protein